MLPNLASLLFAASLANSASIPRQDPDLLNARQDTGDPGLRTYNFGADSSYPGLQ